MNIWRAVAIAVLIAMIAGALLVALMVRAQPQAILCMPDEATREKVRQVMMEALDDGIKTHIARTFSVWMASDVDQPRRAANGVRNGLRAYVGARRFVLTWNPPTCATIPP